MERVRLLLVLFIGAISQINAQEQTIKLSLEDCILLAKKNNLELKEQKIKVEQARLSYTSSKNAYLPSIKANISESLGFGRSQDKTGVFQDRSSSSTSLGLNANLELFSGLRRYYDSKIARLNLKAATVGLIEADENLEIQIIQKYFLWLYFYNSYEISKSQSKRLETQYSLAKEMVNIGKWAKDKVLEIEVTLANTKNTEIEMKNQMIMAKLDLCQTLEKDDNIDFIPLDIENEILSSLPNLNKAQELYEIAKENRPTFKRSLLEIEIAKNNVRLKKTTYLPTIGLSLGYNNSYYFLMEDKFHLSNQSFSDQWKQNGRSYISLNLSIPIFDAFRTRTQVRYAKLDLALRNIRYQKVCKQVKKEILQARQNVLLAKEKMKTSKLSLNLNSRLLNVIEEKVRIGKANQIEYRDAIQKDLIAQYEYLKAKIDFVLKSKVLNFYRHK